MTIAYYKTKLFVKKVPDMRMSNSVFRLARNLSVLTTLLALLSMATSVQAASFRKSWDPEISDSFSSLVGVKVGWRGEAEIFVSDGCIDPVATIDFIAGSATCGTADLESYLLEFYDVADPNPIKLPVQCLGYSARGPPVPASDPNQFRWGRDRRWNPPQWTYIGQRAFYFWHLYSGVPG